jgi:predicted RNA-binding protein with PIN domain
MADPTLYLFDGYNLLHAGPHADRRELVDTLASFVATRGVRGVVVFDGAGDDEQVGPLSVRFVPDADTLLERLAADNRSHERVLLVSSDATVLGTAGRTVANLTSQTFFRDLRPAEVPPAPPGSLANRLDEETRTKLERLRRGDS